MTQISNRAQTIVSNPSPIVTGHIKSQTDPYSNENKSGYLNFGIAQNHLMEKEITEFIKKNNYFTHEDIHYNPGHGKEKLRTTFSKFCQEFLNISSMNPELITVQSGVSALCESLSFCLFDQEDTLLMPAPYYSGFIYDFGGRFNVNLEFVELNPIENFKHNEKTFIDAINKYKPKAVLLTHPYNPTGEVLKKEFYNSIINYCAENDIHIISDEIYALTRLNNTEHESLLEHPYENIHFLYGMAKDFTLAGLKIGFFYTRNKELSDAMQAVSYFHTTSTQTQNTVEHLLSDFNFIQQFIKSNQQKIKCTYEKITTQLPALEHVWPEAGIFFVANFKKLLKENTIKAEIELFNYFLNELKINMTPGHAMGMSDYGYFRVCFVHNENAVDEFIKRFKTLEVYN